MPVVGDKLPFASRGDIFRGLLDRGQEQRVRGLGKTGEGPNIFGDE
jgi:hypothetical protein